MDAVEENLREVEKKLEEIFKLCRDADQTIQIKMQEFDEKLNAAKKENSAASVINRFAYIWKYFTEIKQLLFTMIELNYSKKNPAILMKQISEILYTMKINLSEKYPAIYEKNAAEVDKLLADIDNIDLGGVFSPFLLYCIKRQIDAGKIKNTKAAEIRMRLKRDIFGSKDIKMNPESFIAKYPRFDYIPLTRFADRDKFIKLLNEKEGRNFEIDPKTNLPKNAAIVERDFTNFETNINSLIDIKSAKSISQTAGLNMDLIDKYNILYEFESRAAAEGGISFDDSIKSAEIFLIEKAADKYRLLADKLYKNKVELSAFRSNIRSNFYCINYNRIIEKEILSKYEPAAVFVKINDYEKLPQLDIRNIKNIIVTKERERLIEILKASEFGHISTKRDFKKVADMIPHKEILSEILTPYLLNTVIEQKLTSVIKLSKVFIRFKAELAEEISKLSKRKIDEFGAVPIFSDIVRNVVNTLDESPSYWQEFDTRLKEYYYSVK